MNMDMSSAPFAGVRYADVSLKSLRQSPGLGDIDWHPGSVCGLPGINIVGWYCLEGCVKRVDLVGVLSSRLSRPAIEMRGRGRLRMLVGVKQVA